MKREVHGLGWGCARVFFLLESVFWRKGKLSSKQAFPVMQKVSTGEGDRQEGYLTWEFVIVLTDISHGNL